MKRLKQILIAFVMLISVVIAPLSLSKEKANAVSPKVTYENFSIEVNNILDNVCLFSDRIAGSQNEKEMSNYLWSYLKLVPGVSAVNNDSTKDGIQSFEFMSDFTSNYAYSQNVVFRYTAPEKTDKTVILGCRYDVPAVYSSELGGYTAYCGDALNTSSANIAVLLAFANHINEYGLKYNVEFVFFGASESSYAGSRFYVDGISDEQAYNTLCMINIDDVALGEDLYFYIDEVETDFSKYISSLFDTSKIGTKKVDLVNLNKSVYIEHELGLTYSHIALNSDNTSFMKRKIATINLFAGDYDDGMVFGRCEYLNRDVISYTKFDTREYIAANYGAGVIETNLYQVYETIENILTDENFVIGTTGSYNQTNWFYNIFANPKLVVLLTAIVFIIIVAVAFYVHYKLTVKSYYANVEVEFLSSVVKIAEHIDGESQDKNVPKVISQVIANDIKKNKTLKPEKHKDNEKDKK